MKRLSAENDIMTGGYESSSNLFENLIRTSKEISLMKRFVSYMKAQMKTRSKWLFFDLMKDVALSYLKGRKVKFLKKRMNDAVDAAICQAFSGKKTGKGNGRINLCLMHELEPCQGEALPRDTALLLNCPSGTTDEQTIVAEVAGLVSGNDEIRSFPGCRLSSLNHGCLVVEGLDRASNRILLDALIRIMDDGAFSVRRGRRDPEGEIAIFLDYFPPYLEYLEPGALPDHMISPLVTLLPKLDVICGLPLADAASDVASRGQIMDCFHAGYETPVMIGVFCRALNIRVERFLKLLNAYTRMEFKEIDLDSIRDYAGEKTDKVLKKYSRLIGNHPFLVASVSRSSEKLIKALTRLQLRDVANREAVDEAFRHVSTTLAYVSEIERWGILSRQ